MAKRTNTLRGAAPFEHDAQHHTGYRYTTQAPWSATQANQRLTQVTQKWLQQFSANDTIVDAGCGDGTYTISLATNFPKLTFIGLDPAATAIKLAAAHYPSLQFKVGDLLQSRTLPAADGYILRGVIHHVPQPEKSLLGCLPKTRKLLIIEPNGWNLGLKVIEKLSPYHRAHGERSFTHRQLSQWITQAGGKVQHIRYVGLVPFFCPTWLAKILKRWEPWVEQSWLAPLLCAQVVMSATNQHHAAVNE